MNICTYKTSLKADNEVGGCLGAAFGFTFFENRLWPLWCIFCKSSLASLAYFLKIVSGLSGVFFENRLWSLWRIF